MRSCQQKEKARSETGVAKKKAKKSESEDKGQAAPAQKQMPASTKRWLEQTAAVQWAPYSEEQETGGEPHIHGK